jgi:hypothetical protein
LRGVEPRGHVRPKPMPGREVKPDPAPISPPTFDSSFTPSVAQPHRPPMSPPVLDDPAPAQVAAPPAANLDVTSGLASLLNLSSALAPDAQSLPAPAPPVAPASPPEAPKLRLGPDIVRPNQLPPALADADDKPPSMLKYGIELPSGILEAQAFYEPDGSAPVDLPPAPPSVPAMPQAESAPAQPVAGEAPQSDAGAAAPPLESAPAGATVIQHQSPVVPGAAAPTMMGFTPALPDTEASTTKLGHQAVHVQTPPSDKKG